MTGKNVKIYSTPTCHWCNLAKQFFKENKVEYTDYNVAADTKAANKMVQKTGQMGVPVIDIDGQFIIGFDKARIVKALGLKA